MNIQQLRYAIEVEKTRSITEAADNLFMGQPNLSRAIRELEGALGFALFDRTPRGIVPTARGEEFLMYARGVLAQFDELTARYQHKSADERVFRLSVPRASYISYSFARFAQKLDAAIQLDYKETNALRSIRNVTEDGYDLGIVRCQATYEKYFLDAFRDKGLQSRELWSFRYLALMRADHPAARKPSVTLEDLRDSTVLCHGDSYVPSLPKEKSEPDATGARRIQIYERASQFDLLCMLPRAYMWVSPVPEELLRRHGLVQRPCADNAARHKDMLIYRKRYMLSPLDERFLEELSAVQRALAVSAAAR